MATGSKPRAGGTGARRPAQRRGFSIDSEQSLLLYGVVALVVVAALGFIAFGYWDSVIRARGRTVLQVEDVKVSYAEMKRRMYFDYTQSVNLYLQNPQVAQTIPQATYINLTNELTAIMRAEPDLAVTYTTEEVDAKLREEIGVAAGADQSTFRDSYRNKLRETGLHDNEYRRAVLATLLDTKIRDKFLAEVPPNVPMAKLEVIQTNTRDAAQQAIDRVNAGEPWVTVATELSTDPNAATTGGVQEYQPDGGFNQVYNGYAFSAPVGQVSEPLETGNVFYVVRVVDRSEQPVQEAQKSGIADRRLSQWYTDTQTMMRIVDNWTDDLEAQTDALQPIYDDLGERIEEQERLRLTPPPAPPTVAPTEGAATPGGTPAEGGTPPADTSPAASVSPPADATGAAPQPTAAAP
jgi:parvulin-like peptidyl-prolyl isomerase